MLKPINLKVNYTKPEYAIADTKNPVFTWGYEDLSCKGGKQSGYKIVAVHNGAELWNSGYCETGDMKAVYSGAQLPSGAVIEWTLQLTDTLGNAGKAVQSCFKTACFDDLKGDWIEPGFDCEHRVVNFKKEFQLDSESERAVLYYCGLGLSKPYINGVETDNFRLQPAYTNYKKQAQYIIQPIDASMLKRGKNEIEISVASGWRKNYGKYLDNMSSDRAIEFMGDICLWAKLVIYGKDGTATEYTTDLSWSCTTDKITYSHLFNGEVFDETAQESVYGVKLSDFAPGELLPQYIEPVCVKREVIPVKSYIRNGIRIYDFGENMAGIPHLKANGCCKNVSFIIRHAEEVTETGELFTDALRGAEATDKYICADGECNVDFIPQFTYHGFRYASVEVQGEFDGDVELSALSIYTDIDTDSHFVSGNQTMNEIYRAVLRTERCNLHSVATDCPQRDERMAWMNDATVRFMSMAYNFNIIRLFEKIADDIANEQGADGSLTCTAPFVFGERPADPICSSYLIAVMEHYLQTGDVHVIQKHYDKIAKWNDCLKSYAPDGIVNYSYYGDWAGPADCCYSTATIGNSDVLKTEEYDTGAAYSLNIQGEMVSTAAYYMNLCIMEEFGKLIGRDITEHAAEKERVQKAYLDKWFDKDTVSIGKNSQNECAMSLFVGIIPEEYEKTIAEKMAAAVVDAGMRITTANITTPMLMDMLTKYGYTDIAWKLMTSTEYPSVGNMIANGATTVWERFELKKECGMNSHNHPMYGAMIGWLYRSLAGFETIVPGKSFKLMPGIPEDLKYFEIKIPVLSGSIYMKYENKYGMNLFSIDVPYGVTVEFVYNNTSKKLEGGFYPISFEQ